MKSEMTSTLPFLFYWLNRVPVTVSSVLDLGAGRGVVGALMQVYREPSSLHGVEIHKPYAEFASRFYTSVTVGDALDALSTFPSDSFEIVTCFEMIEHLPKERGYKLLREMERVGQIVFLSTPAKFFPQEEYDDNVHQRHLSLWTAREFRKHGYRVRGFGKAQWLFGLAASILFPRWCANIFAWKVRNEQRRWRFLP